MSKSYRLDADTQVRPAGDHRWLARVHPGWTLTGGTPNGGYLFATALAACTGAQIALQLRISGARPRPMGERRGTGAARLDRR
jgi:hypothetical protein